MNYSDPDKLYVVAGTAGATVFPGDLLTVNASGQLVPSALAQVSDYEVTWKDGQLPGQVQTMTEKNVAMCNAVCVAMLRDALKERGFDIEHLTTVQIAEAYVALAFPVQD
jgi:translation initiation factor 6 (eIF-6)